MKNVNKLHMTMALLLIICVSLGSCSGADNAITATLEDNSVISTAEETTDEKISSDLPKMDLEGYVMDFIVSDPNADGGWYVPHDLVAESENGDVLNDAVYKRNLYLEETYNFTIQMHPSSSSGSSIQKQIKSGDTTYDAIYDSMYCMPNLLTEGYLTDFKSVPYIDTTKPYWAQDAVNGLTLNDSLFYLCGDMVYYSYMGAPAVYFSKKLISDYGLENPYDLVRSGKWTLDKMFNMGKTVAKDLNGDQKFDVDDSIGVIFEDKFILGLFYATGQKLVSQDKNGELQLSFNTTQTVEFIDKMISNMNLNDGTYLLTEKLKPKSGILHQYQQMRYNFNEDRVLFIMSSLASSCGDLKLKETPFGMLPTPKLNEEQSEYHSFLPADVHMLAIPTVVEDLDKVGFILEAMAAESMYTTKVAAYDNMLITRQIRDTESEEMVNIINSSRMFDLGYIYNWGNINGIIPTVVKSSKNTFVSAYEKSSEKAIIAIKKTMDMINDNQ